MTQLTSGAVGVVLCAALTTLAGCATAGSATHASTSSASAPGSPATTSSSTSSAPPKTLSTPVTPGTPSTPSTPSTPTTPPTLGPQSIAIVGRSALGGDLVLRVTAPADTRFRIGQTMELAVACPTTVEKPGDPTAYRVVCPASPHGSQLIATITLGDFEYSFSKPL